MGGKGLSTLVAYGVINTAFYNVGVAVVSLGSGTTDGGVRALLKALAVVWAAGQFIKAPKAALAVALSPAADKAMDRVGSALRLRRRILAAGILTLGMAAFFAVTWGLLLLHGSAAASFRPAALAQVLPANHCYYHGMYAL